MCSDLRINFWPRNTDLRIFRTEMTNATVAVDEITQKGPLKSHQLRTPKYIIPKG